MGWALILPCLATLPPPPLSPWNATTEHREENNVRRALCLACSEASRWQAFPRQYLLYVSIVNGSECWPKILCFVCKHCKTMRSQKDKYLRVQQFHVAFIQPQAALEETVPLSTCLCRQASLDLALLGMTPSSAVAPLVGPGCSIPWAAGEKPRRVRLADLRPCVLLLTIHALGPMPSPSPGVAAGGFAGKRVSTTRS